MIKLAIAVGFLAVFGYALWIIVVLLTNYFKNSEKIKNNKKSKTEDSQLNQKKHDNITN